MSYSLILLYTINICHYNYTIFSKIHSMCFNILILVLLTKIKYLIGECSSQSNLSMFFIKYQRSQVFSRRIFQKEHFLLIPGGIFISYWYSSIHCVLSVKIYHLSLLWKFHIKSLIFKCKENLLEVKKINFWKIAWNAELTNIHSIIIFFRCIKLRIVFPEGVLTTIFIVP